MKKKIFLLLTLIGYAAQIGAAPANNPVANPKAVVQAGNARFTVLTPEMIRIQYSDRQLFEDRATFGVVNRNLPVPEYTATRDSAYLTIHTSVLTLTYKLGSEIKPDDKTTDVLKITFSLNGHNVVWFPSKSDALNLRGAGRTLDGAMGDSKRPEIEPGLLSRAGWAIIDESPKAKRGDGSQTFAFDKQVDGIDWLASPVDKNAVDWYFMGYGHKYRKALGDYVKIGGRTPMPPKYIFGYWYSKYQRYTSQDFMDLANEIEENKIPLDVMIFDMDWHKPDWTAWTWDKSVIPDPKALLDFMHNKKLHVGLNLHPADGVDDDEEGFKEMLSDMHLSPETKVIPWQLADSTFYRSLFKNILHKHEALGVDFWWLDWQQNLTSKYFDGLSETFWCNHVFYNDMKNTHPDRRAVIFHRWGGLGSHRYPIGFSGDAHTTFGTLAFEPYFTATASNVCFGYWGHDLGGHFQFDGNDPELYLRWCQYGVFTPIFRTHATNFEGIERRIWKYSNFTSLRNTVYLRYQLLPYIYNAARQAYDTGVSICRPLYYDYPEANPAYTIEDEYMFGDNILVAPIVTRSDNGVSMRKVWLPEGKWYDVVTGKMTAGGRTLENKYSLEDIPYFYKAGAIIPNNPRIYHLDTCPDTLVLQVVPGADGQLSYYEDGGNDNAYQSGAYTTQLISSKVKSSGIVLTIKPRKGQFNGMSQKRTYRIMLLAAKSPKSVTVNKQKVSDWAYDSVRNTLTVNVAACTFDHEYTVTVKGGSVN